MHYTLQVFETADGFDARNDPARQASYWQGTMAYLQALKEAGIFVSGAGLQPPSTATTLRRSQGQLVVQDGPIAELRGGWVAQISVRRIVNQCDLVFEVPRLAIVAGKAGSLSVGFAAVSIDHQ